ncbi:MAG TPA: flagellar biosynthetic protein FliR [Azospirillaceae bacterium]|nr:flagellar biosynthetic protein FliR [Azospirillaceae bacterium]HRQ82765.1 flagellar biosynthetic protein FliR [Azospirillaceae bacterium]
MNPLSDLLVSQIFAWMLVFARVGTAFSVMPTLGDAFVSMRARLLLSVIVALLVAGAMGEQLPKMPDSPLALFKLIFGEITIGLFIGTVARLMLSALETAGGIIALQAGLANAQMFNPAMASQGSLPGALLGWLGLLLIFATGLHHLLIMAVVESYQTFVPGAPLPVTDMAEHIAKVVERSFIIGFQMATPFLVSGMLFALALGLLSRLAPQIQVFFLFMSVQVALGLFLFAVTLSAIMTFWLTEFEQSLVAFLQFI